MSKNIFYFSLTHKKKLTRKKGLRRKGKREHSRQFYTMVMYKNFILLEYSRLSDHSLTNNKKNGNVIIIAIAAYNFPR